MQNEFPLTLPQLKTIPQLPLPHLQRGCNDCRFQNRSKRPERHHPQRKLRHMRRSGKPVYGNRGE